MRTNIRFSLYSFHASKNAPYSVMCDNVIKNSSAHFVIFEGSLLVFSMQYLVRMSKEIAVQ